MNLPVLEGIIARRLLVNFRVDAAVLARTIPAPFRPKLVNGVAIAGICLIRLEEVRPRGLPAFLGLGSENAAHRIAVEWEADGQRHEGVYVPRRDTNSRLNEQIGGRIFPGIHHHARFTTHDTPETISVALASDDGDTTVFVSGRPDTTLPPTSIFGSPAEASAFFEAGAIGYSATRRAECFDGLELHTIQWRAQPFTVERVESSFFDDRARFPAGSIEFDCALLMRGIAHEWRGLPQLQAASIAAAAR